MVFLLPWYSWYLFCHGICPVGGICPVVVFALIVVIFFFCPTELETPTGNCSEGYYCLAGSPTATPVGSVYGGYFFVLLWVSVLLWGGGGG